MTISFVTGANSGIGRATALRLAREGHSVYGGMRSLDKGDKLADLAAEAGVEVTPVVCDVTDSESVDRAVAEVVGAAGGLDVLVNNAGVGYNATTEDIDIAAGKATFDVNYWGVVRCCQAALPHLRGSEAGHVVNISSIAGRIAAIGQTVYASSKWAVECLSENLAQELAPFGIRVSIVEPGVTRTAILPKNPDHPSPTEYEAAYRRMLQFYLAGIIADVQADVVADTVVDALADETGRLRWPCAWGGEELVTGREALADEDWVALGAIADDDDYYAAFERHFGLPIKTD